MKFLAPLKVKFFTLSYRLSEANGAYLHPQSQPQLVRRTNFTDVVNFTVSKIQLPPTTHLTACNVKLVNARSYLPKVCEKTLSLAPRVSWLNSNSSDFLPRSPTSRGFSHLHTLHKSQAIPMCRTTALKFDNGTCFVSV